MRKINHASLEYPVVIRKVLNDLVFSVPDLGYWKTIPLPTTNVAENPAADSAISSKKEGVLDLEEFFLKDVLEALQETWVEVDQHKNNKKWLPAPSTFKQSLQKNEKDFTLPEFTKELSKQMSISENTVRREIARGVIQCYQTEGGHRRVPFAELEIYISRVKTKKEMLSLG